MRVSEFKTLLPLVTQVFLAFLLNTFGFGKLKSRYYIVRNAQGKKIGEKMVNFTIAEPDFTHFEDFITILCPSHAT